MSVQREMQETGLAFIGSIPSEWAVVPLRHVAHIKYGLGQPPKSKEGGLAIIRATNVERGKLNLKDLITVDPDDVPYDRDPILRTDDIIVVRSGAYTADSAIIPPQFDGAIAGYDMVMRPHAVEPKLLAYALLSRYLRENQLFLKRMRAAQPHLNAEELGTSVLVLPPKQEQQAIVSFLDHQTGLIDALIEKNTQLLELLDLQRKAIINEAVTKGLDPNAPMKDSGVEWLGEVPEGWGTVKLKHLVEMKSGDFISASAIDAVGDFGVYGGNGLRGYTDKFTHDGDHVLIGRQGALCGNVNYATGKFWATEHAVVVTPKGPMDTLYLGELLRTMDLNQYSESAAQPGIAVSKIINLKVPHVPFEEQARIGSYLRDKTSTIDQVKTMVARAIYALGEYRQSLISEAVTGKIDLREWQPEPLSLAK